MHGPLGRSYAALPFAAPEPERRCPACERDARAHRAGGRPGRRGGSHARLCTARPLHTPRRHLPHAAHIASRVRDCTAHGRVPAAALSRQLAREGQSRHRCERGEPLDGSAFAVCHPPRAPPPGSASESSANRGRQRSPRRGGDRRARARGSPAAAAHTAGARVRHWCVRFDSKLPDQE